jgi:hypothetical protein
MACAGNSNEICGGNQRLDVYQSTSASSTKWTSLGCYTDSTSARTLSNYITVPGGTGATTIESCQAACLALGYSLAGVEYANECCKFSFLYHLLTVSNHSLLAYSLRQQNRKRRRPRVLGLQHALRRQWCRDLWWESQNRYL